MAGPNVRAADDVVDMASLKNNIISDIEEGGTNVTTRLANPVIDQMIVGGSNEMDAIALVGNSLAPSYSLDTVLLGQANLARSADALVGCPAAICRHNQMITRDIATSRGLDPYLGWLKGEQNGLPWSHGVTILYDQAGLPRVIDPTNFNRSFGLSDYLTALSNQGIGVNSFTASSFSNWNVEKKLIPK